MRRMALAGFWILILTLMRFDESDSAVAETWVAERIHDRFYAEGSTTGDFDGDGDVDIAAGAVWFEGPHFQTSYPFASVRDFPRFGYSDAFFHHAADFDRDGDDDILVIGFPGQPARLYLNPRNDSSDADSTSDSQTSSPVQWPVFEVASKIDNESPAICDVDGDGRVEIVCGRNGQYGMYVAGQSVTEPWRWIGVTQPGACEGKFTHGLGIGDVDGDGRQDVFDRRDVWIQPDGFSLDSSEPVSEASWQRRVWRPDEPGRGGCQIYAVDVDEDGDADVVTVDDAHGYGLAWYEADGDFPMQRHVIMGASSTDHPHGVTVSQMHAMAIADIDRDGRWDLVTGKRPLAHNGRDPGGLQEPDLYWFERRIDESRSGHRDITFVPHLIDRDSGVGTELKVADVDGDNRPDVISSNKLGLVVHRQQDGGDSALPRWALLDGRDQSTYSKGLDPEQARQNMRVPDGFAVDVMAAEPDVTQPVALCFDSRGRLWVAEAHHYPIRGDFDGVHDPAGKDRILIFEDSNGDGAFDRRTVFIEGLNLISGMAVGYGGVWVGAAPYLAFIPDRDGDDVPDAEPEILLDGWGYQDTHETLNAFTWGPDGWLYGCHGVFTHSRVGKPGVPDDERTPMNAGVWRYHPTRHEFDVFAHGTSNPWGVDFNDVGDAFVTACVIPHLYHLSLGGRYQRQAGQHFNAATYQDIQTIADHAHYAGNLRDHAFWGENYDARPAAATDTSLLGGGHAHCGLVIYDGDVFPSDFRGEMLFHNLHGHRVVRETLRRDGSGYVGRHRPDFALSRDHDQIGVAIRLGPDGAIYTSDWHDPQTCHHRDPNIWNRMDGRIFRIRYGQAISATIALEKASDADLLGNVGSQNGFMAERSALVLRERHAEGTLDGRTVAKLWQRFAECDDRRERLRLLWLGWSLDEANVDVERLLVDNDPMVRKWMLRLLADRPQKCAKDFCDWLSERFVSEPDPQVRRAAASLAGRLPEDRRFAILEALASRTIDSADRNLPWLTWYALEPLVPENPRRCLNLAADARLPQLYPFVVRRLAESQSGRDQLVAFLRDEPNASVDPVLNALLQSGDQRGGKLAAPKRWATLEAELAKRSSVSASLLIRVSAMFGSRFGLEHFRRVLDDSSETVEDRIAALSVLRGQRDPGLVDRLPGLLDEPGLTAAVVAAMGDFDGPECTEALIEGWKSLPEAVRPTALAVMASRVASGKRLVRAMREQLVEPEQVPAYIVRQLLSLDDADIRDTLPDVWGRIASDQKVDADIRQHYRAVLTPRKIRSASLELGQALYEKNCGQCHRLFERGGQIGPDLTGANRSSVDYWLENILQPSALVGRQYQTTLFMTDDGRVVSGIVQSRNEDAVSVQTATDLVVIRTEVIAREKPSTVSLMPEGQLEQMSDDDVRSLFRYLMQ